MENIFADAEQEGQATEKLDLPISKEEKTPTDSQPETKPTEQPSQGGDSTPEEKLPFHKHPRWIKQQQANEALKAELDELKKFRDSAEPLLKTQQKEVTLPDWWTKVYGSDETSKANYRNYEAATNAERDRIKEEVKNEIKSEQEKSQQENSQGEQKAQEFIDTQLAEMQEEGFKFETNVLMKFLLDFEKDFGIGGLLDAKGNYDLRKALKLMQIHQPQQGSSNDARKKIASDTMKSKAPRQASGIPIFTSRMRRGNWRDAE